MNDNQVLGSQARIKLHALCARMVSMVVYVWRSHCTIQHRSVDFGVRLNDKRVFCLSCCKLHDIVFVLKSCGVKGLILQRRRDHSLSARELLSWCVNHSSFCQRRD